MMHQSHWAAKLAAAVFLFCGMLAALGQIDPEKRNLLEFGYDLPLSGEGPYGIYAYYYYNNPDFFNTNTALRVAIAPVYLDSELGFKGLISPTTDVGLGIQGGAYEDSFYEVRQGEYYKADSFDGYGGGASVSLYQLFNPGMMIPLSAIVRGGFHYSSYDPSGETADNFVVPGDRVTTYTRAGLRFGGKEPELYPDLGLELSTWFEQQWRTGTSPYGINNDDVVNARSQLYWLYAGMSYAWTNTGQAASLAITAGDSDGADRFSAYRLGGVLPLIAEYPLVLPGYYYEELTATRFVHMYTSYEFPLIPSHSLQFRLEAATACLDYLPGYEQPGSWETGAGCGLMFTPKTKNFRIELRYGYGFNALRDGHPGAQSVGVLFEYDFEKWWQNRHHE